MQNDKKRSFNLAILIVIISLFILTPLTGCKWTPNYSIGYVLNHADELKESGKTIVISGKVENKIISLDNPQNTVEKLKKEFKSVIEKIVSHLSDLLETLFKTQIDEESIIRKIGELIDKIAEPFKVDIEPHSLFVLTDGKNKILCVARASDFEEGEYVVLRGKPKIAIKLPEVIKSLFYKYGSTQKNKSNKTIFVLFSIEEIVSKGFLGRTLSFFSRNVWVILVSLIVIIGVVGIYVLLKKSYII